MTNRIIALGFPANGFEGLYRNSRSDIINFLKDKHGNMVKVYNLCAEQDYVYSLDEVSPFSIQRFPFKDHNVCQSMQTVHQFCLDAALFLSRMEMYYKTYKDIDGIPEEQTPVIAVHCKAGKGRTGMMICSLLLFLECCPSAKTSI